MPNENLDQTTKKILLFFFLVVLPLVVIAIMSPNALPNTLSNTLSVMANGPKQPDLGAIYYAERAVEARLYDPDSAQFQNVVATGTKGYETVRGRVNAKNRFGGYAGYKYFTYQRATRSLNIED